MPNALLLQCPAPCDPFCRQRDDEKLVDELSALARSVSTIGIDRLFGLELRAAFHLSAHAVDAQKHHQPLRKFFLRPAYEPILFSFHGTINPNELNKARIDEMMSVMRGIPSAVRNSDAKSTKDEFGNFAQFPECIYASKYIDRIHRGISIYKSPIERSAFVFAETVLSHPYSDGNARLARCLAMLTLYSSISYCFPFYLPLGPVMMAHNDIYISALQNLSHNKNWSIFIDIFHDFILNSIDITRDLIY